MVFCLQYSSMYWVLSRWQSQLLTSLWQCFHLHQCGSANFRIPFLESAWDLKSITEQSPLLKACVVTGGDRNCFSLLSHFPVSFLGITASYFPTPAAGKDLQWRAHTGAWATHPSVSGSGSWPSSHLLILLWALFFNPSAKIIWLLSVINNSLIP